MRHRSHGLALIYIIVLMSLLSVYFIELMNNARTMLNQTRRAELVAVNRNLQTSARIWTFKNASSIPPQGITLDTARLSKRQATITITPEEQIVRIQTTCTLATQTDKQTRKIKF